MELLVAITIFSILAGIAISAFRGTQDDDRIAAAAQQLKSTLEGARSRAIHDKAPRGVRLLRDPNNPTMVNALQYIGLAPNDEGFIEPSVPAINKVVQYFTAFDRDGPGGSLTLQRMVIPIGATVSAWRQLVTASPPLIVAGNRIELPKGSGKFYVISQVIDLDGANARFGLQLAEPLETDLGQWIFPGPVGNFPFVPPPPPVGGLPGVPKLDYSLELGVAPLPGSEPVPLPKGTVIDLDASAIPDFWRPNPAVSGSAGSVDYPGDYPNVDILFASNGKMIGPVATTGIFHLYVGNLEEVDKYMQANWTPGTPSSGRPITQTRNPDIPGGANTPQKPTKLVTVLTASGQVYSSEVNFEGTTVAQKLKYAKSGKETP